MSPVIVFPDVELWATDFLRAQLPGHGYSLWTAAAPDDAKVFVSNQRQSQKTAVWVRRDGGPGLDVVRETARLGINIFAPSEQSATDLARMVSALLRAAADGTPVLRVEQTSGPSAVADDTKLPRRYMTFDIDVRGVQI